VVRDSIYGGEDGFEGEVNKNIRASLALMEMTKPYIEINEVSPPESKEIKVTFTISGCLQLDPLSILLKDKSNNTITSQPLPSDYCLNGTSH
jgi:hypothetical protein